MSQSAIVFPALVQAVMSLLLLPLLGAARARSLREQKLSVDADSVRLGRNAWSDEATKISNSYRNQFESPVLFFAVVTLALVLKQADQLMIALAWAYALSRIAHAAVHIGQNVIRWRAVSFLAGVVVLLAMWLLLGWRVWTGA